MLLSTNKMIPEVYGKERDIQVFTRLLDIILSCCKYDIDNIGDIYDPERCHEEFLPLFAKTLNFEYNYGDSVSANRTILKIFTLMEKWRGSQRGLRIAAALSLTSFIIAESNNQVILDDIYLAALRDLQIRFNYEEGKIEIDYPNTYTLVRYLIDYVRPVGMGVELRAIASKNINTDALLIYADTESMVREYIPLFDSGVSKNFVNFSIVGDPDYGEHIKQWQDAVGNQNSTFSFGGD